MISKAAYSQVYSIINFLGEDYKNKIPSELLKTFESERDMLYCNSINPLIPLEKQVLLKDTVDILAMLKLSYWCKNEEEKNELLKILSENDKKYQEELREKCDFNTIMKNNSKGNLTIDSRVLTVEKKESFLEKIKKWWKAIFNK